MGKGNGSLRAQALNLGQEGFQRCALPARGEVEGLFLQPLLQAQDLAQAVVPAGAQARDVGVDRRARLAVGLAVSGVHAAVVEQVGHGRAVVRAGGNGRVVVGEEEQAIVAQGGKALAQRDEDLAVQKLDGAHLLLRVARVAALVRGLDVQGGKVVRLQGAQRRGDLAGVVGVDLARGALDRRVPEPRQLRDARNQRHRGDDVARVPVLYR